MIVTPTEDGITNPDTTIEELAVAAAAAAAAGMGGTTVEAIMTAVAGGTTIEKEKDAVAVAGGVAMEALVAGRMSVTMDMGLLVITRRQVRGQTIAVMTIGTTSDRIIIGSKNAGAETMVRAAPVGSSRGQRRRLTSTSGERVVSSTSSAVSSSSRVSDARTGAVSANRGEQNNFTDGEAVRTTQERIKPLEEVVTKDTWNECSWDQRIASQHPDWPTAGNRVDGETYLRPGQKIEAILTTCPFGSLRDGSKGEVWFAKKVKAADAAFQKALRDAEPDEIDNLPVSEEDVKKFFDALPYNVTFLIGFDVLGVNAKDERNCLCPCSSKCAKWRRQFGIERILEDFGKKEACVNTFKSSGPYALIQHLNQKAGQRIGLHYFVRLYVEALYGSPYCGRVGHKGLYPPSSAEYKKAEAYERKKDIQ